MQHIAHLCTHLSRLMTLTVSRRDSNARHVLVRCTQWGCSSALPLLRKQALLRKQQLGVP